jgi:hypothetical protein
MLNLRQSAFDNYFTDVLRFKTYCKGNFLNAEIGIGVMGRCIDGFWGIAFMGKCRNGTWGAGMMGRCLDVKMEQ